MTQKLFNAREHLVGNNNTRVTSILILQRLATSTIRLFIEVRLTEMYRCATDRECYLRFSGVALMAALLGGSGELNEMFFTSESVCNISQNDISYLM